MSGVTKKTRVQLSREHRVRIAREAERKREIEEDHKREREELERKWIRDFAGTEVAEIITNFHKSIGGNAECAEQKTSMHAYLPGVCDDQFRINYITNAVRESLSDEFTIVGRYAGTTTAGINLTATWD